MDLDIPLGQGLEDGEHHALLAQGGGVLDFERFREFQQFCRLLFLEVLERHAAHTIKKGGLVGFFCHDFLHVMRNAAAPDGTERNKQYGCRKRNNYPMCLKRTGANWIRGLRLHGEVL